MQTVALARNAMATRFEIVLHGANAVALRAAGEEALDEIDRWEAQLSLYRPASDISRVNLRAATEPVRVDPRVFGLLRHAQQLHRESGGAFDITIAPLMRCWGFMQRDGQLPGSNEWVQARSNVGMHLVSLSDTDFTVRFAREGVMLDLGSIGKGYALERAANLLRDAGVTSALLHGGTSTVCAIGAPPDAECWKIAIDHPGSKAAPILALGNPAETVDRDPRAPLAVIPLTDEALSVSAVWGKSFESGGKTYGHVIDPRSGKPTEGAVLAAVALPSATETDAFSTALLILGLAGIDRISTLRPHMRTLVSAQEEGPGSFSVAARGIEVVV